MSRRASGGVPSIPVFVSGLGSRLQVRSRINNNSTGESRLIPLFEKVAGCECSQQKKVDENRRCAPVVLIQRLDSGMPGKHRGRIEWFDPPKTTGSLQAKGRIRCEHSGIPTFKL